MRVVRQVAVVVLVVVVGVLAGALWPAPTASVRFADNPFARSGATTGQTSTAGSAAPASTGVGVSDVTGTTVPGPPVTPIAWAPCQSGLQCGSISVPLDYNDPASPTISIALARHPAEDPAARIGSIVINPGGPGGSGIDDLPSELSVMTSGLLERFDVVSFDPRGVDRSAPVTCGETGGPASQGPLPDPDPPTAAGQQAVVQNDQAYAAQCAAASGLILPFVGTVDTARDLDRIRQALGDAQLTYIGHSYGTLLGLTYADMFPTHVRAMVLDGVIDPSISGEQMVEDQAVGFENVLDDFFNWCASSSSCSWRPGSDPTNALLGMISQSRQSPLPAGGGRTAGPGEFYTAVLSGLYNTSGWARLGSALGEAAAGNGSGLVSMSDSYDTENGPNSVDADTAISCLDHPVNASASSFPSLAAQAGLAAPVFGPMLMWGLLECAVWPAAPTRVAHAVRATGAPPILVVGTSGDPATPHKWAVDVAAQLQHGVLVTWDGVDHVAYYYSSCVRSIDQAYLIGGTLPASGTTCTD